MLGGASRYYDERYREGFAQECRALKRFGRVEGFEPSSSSKTWTFWTYVVRAVEEFGPVGRKIHRQVSRLKRRARHRVDEEIVRALERRAKNGP